MCSGLGSVVVCNRVVDRSSGGKPPGSQGCCSGGGSRRLLDGQCGGVPVVRIACATVFGQKVCWPGGYLGHSIKGSKLKITREDANVEDLVGAGVVGGIYCNYQFTFSYYNTSGDLYRSRKSPMVSKCTSYGDSPIGHVFFNKDITLAHAGRACARFIANGKTLATQCHNISK